MGCSNLYFLIDLSDYISEQNAEFFTVDLQSLKTTILTNYRSGEGNSDRFLVNFELIIHKLLKRMTKINNIRRF